MTDWYENRHKLEDGMVFEETGGTVIRLDRRVPGDGTDWYADVLHQGTWLAEDFNVHPGDLVKRHEDLESQDFPKAIEAWTTGTNIWFTHDELQLMLDALYDRLLKPDCPENEPDQALIDKLEGYRL